MALHQQGRTGNAERLYLDILQAAPNNADALHLLGVLRAQQGDHAAAGELMTQALAANPANAAIHTNLAKVLIAVGRLDAALSHCEQALAIGPNNPGFHNDHGGVLAMLRRLDEALAAYDRALALAPDRADTHCNRGNVLRDLGRSEEALAAYDRALELAPDHTAALNNRSNVLIALKRPEEALAGIDRALTLAPNDAQLHYNRGNALHQLARFDEALASYDRALAIAPHRPEALINRGNVLRALDRIEEALASYDSAVTAKPDSAQAWSNRGNALRQLDRLDDALASFDRALAIDPNYAEALNNRGNALRSLGRFDEAIASYDRALAIDPDDPEIHFNRGNALRSLKRFDEAATCYQAVIAQGRAYDFALGDLFDANLHVCNWRDYDHLRSRLIAAVTAGRWIDNPFHFLSTGAPADVQLACARLYADEKLPPIRRPLWNGERYTHEKIRIAYLSADFREHPVSHLLAGVIERHDRSRFEVIAISYAPRATDGVGRRIGDAFDRFIDISGTGDRDVAHLIRSLDVDIAVDLMGYTSDSRPILRFRPAPVQVNYLGYSGTLGVPYIDYIIADRIVIPPGQMAGYSEAVVHLPNSYMPTDSAREISPLTMTRADAGLPEDGIVFASFNNSYKITPAVFDVWMRLLKSIEKSALWLADTNPVARRNLLKEAKNRGVASERIVFAARTATTAEHLARLQLADLVLDTLPYGGHASTCDALWAGVPVVTCAGDAFAGRVAASLLAAVGLPELTTSSIDAYEALARTLATDRAELKKLRARLLHNRTTQPLFNTDLYCRGLERAYTTMAERVRRGEAPARFAVS
jgi:predicted O-linked N-acetylglucosamine transferase (SPINDLY family)